MEDIRSLALDAALRLDQASRGRDPDPGPAATLGLRFACATVRRSLRDASAHRAALSAAGLPHDSMDEIDEGLASIGRDLLAASGRRGDGALLARCLTFCVALREATALPPAGMPLAT